MSTTERILDIFLMVANTPNAMTAKEIVQQSGLPMSTVYRLLSALVQAGLVAVAPHELGYIPGPMCLRIAANASNTSLLLTQSLPVMQALAIQTGESVALMVPIGKEAVCLEMIESTQALRCSFSRGRAQPLLRGASAKALLANLPNNVQQQVIHYFEATDKVPIDFQQELDAIRSQGYAVSDSEVDAGVWGVSAPIFSAQGLEGGLSLMAPSVRAVPKRDQFIELVVESARQVSRLLVTDQDKTRVRSVPERSSQGAL